MTEISSDNEGPYPSDSAPIEGTQVTDASSTSSTKDALAQISTAMLKLTTEMSQLRQQQQHIQQSGLPQPYQPHVQSYGVQMMHTHHFQPPRHLSSVLPVPRANQESTERTQQRGFLWSQQRPPRTCGLLLLARLCQGCLQCPDPILSTRNHIQRIR